MHYYKSKALNKCILFCVFNVTTAGQVKVMKAGKFSVIKKTTG